MMVIGPLSSIYDFLTFEVVKRRLMRALLGLGPASPVAKPVAPVL